MNGELYAKGVNMQIPDNLKNILDSIESVESGNSMGLNNTCIYIDKKVKEKTSSTWSRKMILMQHPVGLLMKPLYELKQYSCGNRS